MKKITYSLLVIITTFSITGCYKEELPEPTPAVKISRYQMKTGDQVVGLNLGNTSEKVCSGSFTAEFKVDGVIRALYSDGKERTYSTSTDNFSTSTFKLKCSDYLLKVNELLPNPQGGTELITGDEIQESITTDVDGNCSIKVKPGKYAGMIVSGRTDFIGKDPLNVGLSIGSNIAVKSFSLICP